MAATSLDWSSQFWRPFHWQYSGVLIPFFVAGGIAMIGFGLASDDPDIIRYFFILAYLFLVAGFLWTIGYWLTSEFIRNLRRRARTVRKREKRRAAQTKYYAWQYCILVLILLVGCLTIFFTNRIEQTRRLSTFVGKLIPASDPQTGACGGASGNEAVLLVGTAAYKIGRWPQTILSVNGKPRIVMERGDSGAIGLTAQVFSSDGRIITDVLKNAFNINKNNIFRTERPDDSTIIVFDQNNDRTLYIRHNNRYEITFDAKLYYRDYGDVDIFNRFSHLCIDISSGARSVFEVK